MLNATEYAILRFRSLCLIKTRTIVLAESVMQLLRDLDFWLKVAGIAVPGLITLIVPFVIYRRITRNMADYQARLSKDLAVYQAEINKGLEDHQGEIGRELEVHKFKLQSVFQAKFYQYQTRHSWLHQKRAEAIEKLFELLARVQNDLIVLDKWEVSSPLETKEEFYAKTRNDFANLINFTDEKRIYFSSEVAEKLRAIVSAVQFLLVGPMSIEYLGNSISTNGELPKNQARKILEEGIHPLMAQLDLMFKRILSAETPMPQPALPASFNHRTEQKPIGRSKRTHPSVEPISVAPNAVGADR